MLANVKLIVADSPEGLEVAINEFIDCNCGKIYYYKVKSVHYATIIESVVMNRPKLVYHAWLLYEEVRL